MKNLMMKKLVLAPVLVMLMATTLPAGAQEQDAVDTDVDTQQTQREERINELRQLLREDRAARREAIQAQLDTLTDEQRAALQERRQMQRQARNARMARGGQRGTNRCQCPESSSAESDS